VELTRGITGFRRFDEPALPTCDLRAFRGFCHSVARTVGGRVLSVEAPVAGAANFARVVLELPDAPVAVVLNSHHPVVAFVAPPFDNETELRFVAAPALSDLFQRSGTYTVLTDSEARGPVTAEARRLLAPAELEQLRYWRPRCVGEVVFNHWD
jgi:hypothetical protein